MTVRRPRPWVVGHSLLRSALSVSPRHEFIQLCDLVVGDAAKNVGKPGLRIDTAELCRFDRFAVSPDAADAAAGPLAFLARLGRLFSRKRPPHVGTAR